MEVAIRRATSVAAARPTAHATHGCAMTAARNHHVVSQGYLRGFADGTGRQAKVHVIDSAAARAFRTLVRNVGARRDFNRVEMPHVDANALETVLGEFEGDAVPALRRIEERRSFDDEGDKNLVLNLIALMAVRNPHLRARVSKFIGEINRKAAGLLVGTPERWEHALARAIEAGDLVSEDTVTYDEARDFLRSDQYRAEPHQNFNIALELDSHDSVLQALGARQWCLVVAEDQAGDFVTCDHPVRLVDLSRNPTGPYRLGFGMTQTAVVFPVGRRVCLYGTFEHQEKIRSVNSLQVAHLNAHIIGSAERQIYAHDERFCYLLPGRVVRQGTDLLNDLAARNRDG